MAALRLFTCRSLKWIHPHRKLTSSSISGSFSARFSALLEKRLGDNRDGLDCEEITLLKDARSNLIASVGLGNVAGRDGTANNVTPEVIVSHLCDHYESLKGDEKKKRGFLSLLAGDLAVEHEKVLAGAAHFVNIHSQSRSEGALLKSESSLRQSLTPFYCELFSVIAKQEGGIKFLVDIRGDLLDLIKGLHESGASIRLLSEMDVHLRDSLSQWFAPQLLDLQQITWESPCDLLEKISAYEAVHKLRHWKDLKHRLGANRRCFAFMHKAIPREPIVVLHAALTDKPSSSIQTLLDRAQDKKLEDFSTAVFYSISATQKGLSGVELGNFLIEGVVQKLQSEFPRKLTTFVTLSPIPGFRRWLDSYLILNMQKEEDSRLQITRDELSKILQLFPECGSHFEALQRALGSTGTWAVERNGHLAQAMKQPLVKLCSRYLALVKRRGRTIDPVAHFHLSNGASIGRVNWLADTSPKGLHQSYGLMTNYHYHLPDVNRNSEAYRMNGTITVSDTVQSSLE